MKSDSTSSTALLIGRAILLMNQSPAFRPLILPGSVQLANRWLRLASGGGWFWTAMRLPGGPSLLFKIQQWLAPGLFLHFLLRKRRLDRMAREAIASGCRQVVVIGAGLDSLAWRLASDEPSIACFELDHPASQSLKERYRNQHPSQAPHLLPLDLRETTPAALLASTPLFNPKLPTFYVAEGLFMYLPGERVAEIVNELANTAPAGSRFAFTFLERRSGKPLGFRADSSLIRRWLSWRKEPFLWGLPLDELPSWTHNQGWKLRSVTTSENFRTHDLPSLRLANAPLAEGENIALLELPQPPNDPSHAADRH